MGSKAKAREKSYTTISIPIPLAKAIDNVIASGKHGYKNRPDFVIDAIRKRLRELGFLE
ncbi:MAG: ribbon-helix-helix domain-containing protein [Candidatus Bathyarchaeia archaeon]